MSVFLPIEPVGPAVERGRHEPIGGGVGRVTFGPARAGTVVAAALGPGGDHTVRIGRPSSDCPAVSERDRERWRIVHALLDFARRQTTDAERAAVERAAIEIERGTL